jgi:hypothetical protein
MSRPAPQVAARSENRPRQEPTKSSSLSTKYTGPYTGVIFEHCKGRYKTDDCWHLYPEKKPYRNRERSNTQKETTEKELDTRPKAHSVVAAIARVCSWILDSAASFHIMKEAPDALNRS